jgi:hypothetical protein
MVSSGLLLAGAALHQALDAPELIGNIPGLPVESADDVLGFRVLELVLLQVTVGLLERAAKPLPRSPE